MDRREWERRNADIYLYETGWQLESQKMELYQARINWQIKLEGDELAIWRIRYEKQKSSKKIAQDIAKKLKIF